VGGTTVTLTRETNVSEAKHTPGKLVVDDGDSRVLGLFAEDCDAVAYLSENAAKNAGLRDTETDLANANRLALCWNMHDELVAACRKAILACQDNLKMWQYKNEPLLQEAFDACKEIIAKVEGQPQ
jgi:hypothetical protein